MSRSLGDTAFDHFGVLSVPEITNHALGAHDACVVLASDGLWEVLDSQAVINICFEHKKSATDACHELVKRATAKWHSSNSTYIDDITIIVAFLQDNNFLESPSDPTEGSPAPPGKKRSLVEEVFQEVQQRRRSSIDEAALPQSGDNSFQGDRSPNRKDPGRKAFQAVIQPSSHRGSGITPE
eukprot:6245828-Prymnesium_polylepis.1